VHTIPLATNPAQLTDEQLEIEIEQAFQIFVRHRSQETWLRFAFLVSSRTPAVIARMERERGLVRM
jgi:hypothetical protein